MGYRGEEQLLVGNLQLASLGKGPGGGLHADVHLKVLCSY